MSRPPNGAYGTTLEPQPGLWPLAAATWAFGHRFTRSAAPIESGKRIELGHRSLAPATFLKVRFAGLFETWTPPADYCNHTTCERTHRAVNPRGTRAAAPFLSRRIRNPLQSGMCAASLASPLAPPPPPFSPACAGLPKTIAKPRTLTGRGERGPKPRAKDESPR